jgi:hypothetical protein
MAARLNADASVATSQELLRAAMRRSDRRNAGVARRRLWLRWVLWGLGRAGRYLSVPILMVSGMLVWVHHGGQLPLLSPPSPGLQAHAHSASAAVAPPPREDLAPPSLQLRLDAELPQRRRMPQAQSRKPMAQEKDPAPATQQETP